MYFFSCVVAIVILHNCIRKLITITYYEKYIIIAIGITQTNTYFLVMITFNQLLVAKYRKR